ncbi:hypothetical protein PHLGIDRAFT_70108 [Phlebiopsis gigantea 11061_1 CR5-6]|uniref:BZIP domain-containing protein n=1 Tax=Phlebiopsis gigantea (strain 11061_1 CR5-6) TaxID=745531 RepID=A0A0C3RZY3_PHLG1|nr:hypothetical protein PHLGIDRAFT_70108 [Phlebiopsis gigantea 11061_1 CR5-6]
MSSKRGRKRNDNLPPNRARDVQRAFRARRAAHLEASPNRVAELEEENNTLRAALSLPPANRPALGKGPTGKDKPKSYAPRPNILASQGGSSAMLGNGMSRTESPSSASTRTHSMSPTSMVASLNAPAPPPVVSVDSASWDDGLFGARERAEVQPSPVTASYPVTPLSASGSTSSYQFPAANSQIRPLGQQSYMSPAQNYTHNGDRPLGDAYADANSLYDHRQFSYAPSAFQASPDGSRTQMHAQSPPTVSMPPQRGNGSIQPPMNYAHKRSVTEPSQQALRHILLQTQSIPPISHLQQHQQHSPGRGPSPPGMDGGIGQLRAADFEMDARGGRMSSLPS